MIEKLEKKVHDNKTETLFCKTLGLNNPETYVLLDYRFNFYMVIIFSDINKAQTYKMPYRDSPHLEIEILMSFDYLNFCKPHEHTEDYHIRKPNDKTFLLEIEVKKYVYVGNKVFSNETSDKKVKFFSKNGYNDVKYPYAYGKENIYLMLQKNCITFVNAKIQHKKTSISVCITRTMN